MKKLPFEPKAGMILGTTSASPLAHAIRWWTAGPFRAWSRDVASHIVCVIRWKNEYYEDILIDNEKKYDALISGPEVKDNELIGVEATWPRTRFIRLDKYNGFGKPHYVFAAMPNPEITEQQIAAVSKELIHKVGKLYDLRGLFERLGACKDDPKKDYCSEVARGACVAQNYYYPPEFDFGVSPFDWQKHFEATNKNIYRCYKEFWG